MSRRRTPSGDELELWEKVTETVAPLVRPRPKAPPKPKPAAAKPAPPGKMPRRAKAIPPLAPPPPPKPQAPPALNPFDRRTLSRIGRGTVAIDARIDLHGMTQDAAQGRLSRFLEDAQARGARVVLVITGKGKPGSGGEERGVLRRVVPHWLSSPKLRPLVVGFDEAGPGHGGSGALYVRIRKGGRG